MKTACVALLLLVASSFYTADCRFSNSKKLKHELLEAVKDSLYEKIEEKLTEDEAEENDEENLLDELINELSNDVNNDDDAECDSRCGSSPWEKAGRCNKKTGRCQCAVGWTGPDSKYVSEEENIIEADYCVDQCNYDEDNRNPACVYDGHKKIYQHFHEPCNKLCGKWGTGSCQTNGRCLCHPGWTGPSALYVQHGRYEGKVVADHCLMACNYGNGNTPEKCAGNHYNYQLVHQNRHGDALAKLLVESLENN